MDSGKTSLSAGALIRAALLANPVVAGRVSRVFPVFTPTDAATLPCICYRRSALSTVGMKRQPSDDTATIEIMILTATYDEGVTLAEAVRATLDGMAIDSFEEPGISARRCQLVNAVESYADDAFSQLLTFNCKIQ